MDTELLVVWKETVLSVFFPSSSVLKSIQKKLTLDKNGGRGGTYQRLLGTDIFVKLMDRSSVRRPSVVRLCLTLCVLSQTFPSPADAAGTFEPDCKYVIFTLTVETTFC